MIFRKIFILSYLIISFSFGISQQLVHSPDKKIVFAFSLNKTSPSYHIIFNGKQIINESTLGLDFENGTFQRELSSTFQNIIDTFSEYNLFAGKTKHVKIRYSQLTVLLNENIYPHRQIVIRVRVFNDGVAFRYEFPNQERWQSYVLNEENTYFQFSGDPYVHALLFPNFTSSHEGLYNKFFLKDIKKDTLMDLPALFQIDHIYVAITEAALLDYAAMYLSNKGNGLVSTLSPLPFQKKIKVKTNLPGFTPWRVLLISEKPGTLIESNIITSLNQPSRIKDLSWLKLGKTTFPWWNGNVLPDTINAPGNNFVTAKYYIDFCARNNIAYHSVVEYGLHQWYVDDGIGFQPGPHSDVTTPVPGLSMKEICDYAISKGVGIRVWVHWAALYPKIDSAFSVFEKWGISGMMIDFMDRDDQEMVNIQTEMLEKAAIHHMHIQFHGAYRPTGINRTYPNEFTREGTLNYEVNKWSAEGIGPDHDISIPFTRMIAGSTDYHLGGFRAVNKKDFKAQYTKPLMLSTRAHMLAMYVVLENYLQMVCDFPAAYEGQKGFDFIKVVPTSWDETKVLNAEVDNYITIARRKDNYWYVGGITNHESRNIHLPMSFLSKGQYEITIYSDGNNVKKSPNDIKITRQFISEKETINIKLAEGGGFAMVLRKLINQK